MIRIIIPARPKISIAFYNVAINRGNQLPRTNELFTVNYFPIRTKAWRML